MNIKKMTAAIFTLIAVVLIIGAGTLFFITSKDEIADTDISEFTDNNFGVTKIVYNTESGDPIGLSANYNVFKLGDGESGLYRINITLRQEESKSYGLKKLSFNASFSDNDLIISKYCTGGNSLYFEPQIDYRDAGKQRIICDFEGNYAYIDLIVQLDMPHEIPVEFTYDISGKSLNFLNGFPDQSFDITIPCH